MSALLVPLAISGGIGFMVGVLVGYSLARLPERRKEMVMSSTQNARRWFDRNGILLYGVVAVLALVGIWISTAATITNGRQDAERAAENVARDAKQAELLSCFDGILSDITGTLPQIRAASVVRDDATKDRDAALQRLVTIIISANGSADDEYRIRFARAVSDLAVAGERLEDAQDALALVRLENPYPGPPSQSCA